MDKGEKARSQYSPWSLLRVGEFLPSAKAEHVIQQAGPQYRYANPASCHRKVAVTEDVKIGAQARD